MHLGAGGRTANVNFSVDILVTNFYHMYLVKAIYSQRAMNIPGEHRRFLLQYIQILTPSQNSLQFKLKIT